MRIELDGRQVTTFDRFLADVAVAVDAPDGYFGWDLHSLRDCLHGGYGGEPPYEVVVMHGEAMVEAFGHDALVRYCDTMLDVIANGGRGLIDAESKVYWESTRRQAANGQGGTLLDFVLEAVCTDKSSLVLLDGSGGELRSTAPLS